MDEECIGYTDHDPGSYFSLPTPSPPAIDEYGHLALPPPLPGIEAPRAVLPSPEISCDSTPSADTGSSVSDSEGLEQILAKIDTSDSGDSSDSDMERNRKRESISIMPGSFESFQMARRFTGSSEGSRGSGSRLQGVEE